MPPLKITLEKALAVGPSLLNGGISDAELETLYDSFKAKGDPRSVDQPDENNYTQKYVIDDFVNYIGPYFSKAALHQLNQRLAFIEAKKKREQNYRTSTLAAAMLRYEARTYGFGVGLLSHLQQNTLDLNKIFIPDVLKKQYSAAVVPILEQQCADKMIPQKRVYTVVSHLLFNCLQAIILDEISEKLSEKNGVVLSIQLKAVVDYYLQSDEFVSRIYKQITDAKSASLILDNGDYQVNKKITYLLSNTKALLEHSPIVSKPTNLKYIQEPSLYILNEARKILQENTNDLIAMIDKAITNYKEKKDTSFAQAALGSLLPAPGVEHFRNLKSYLKIFREVVNDIEILPTYSCLIAAAECIELELKTLANALAEKGVIKSLFDEQMGPIIKAINAGVEMTKDARERIIKLHDQSLVKYTGGGSS